MNNEEAKKRKIEILKMTDPKERFMTLQELAKEVGAATEHTKIADSSTQKHGTETLTVIYQNPISESELVQNINQALQTASMIDMCKIANRNFIIALVVAGAAILSALGALILAFK